MQVVVDDLLTHYQSAGDGPVVLLLHGWGDRLETFDALAKQLMTAYRVVRLDLPGFGGTQPPGTVWGLSDYASFVSQFLDKLEISDLHAVIAHSNGGAVAIVGLASKKVTANKLILLASAGVRNTQAARKLVLNATAKAGKAATFWLPKHHKLRLQRRFYGTIGSDMLVAPHLQETFKRTVAEDILDCAAELKVPTLLIYGDHDTATPVNHVGVPLHQAIKNSKLNILHGADHFVHHTASEQVTSQVKEFLSW